METEDRDNLYFKTFTELQSNKDIILDKVRNLLSRNINYLRNFHLHLLTISVTVIGAVLTALSFINQEIIQSRTLAVLGLICFFTEIIYIILYTNSLLIFENKDITKRINFFNSSFSESLNVNVNFYKENKPFSQYREEHLRLEEKFDKEEKEIINESNLHAKKDYHLWLIGSIFIAGIVFIILSALPKDFYEFFINILFFN